MKVLQNFWYFITEDLSLLSPEALGGCLPMPILKLKYVHVFEKLLRMDYSSSPEWKQKGA